MRKTVTLLLYFIVCSHLLPAQNGNIKGRINIDAADSFFHAQNVTVSLHRAKDSAITASALAAQDGAYSFAAAENGTYFISASAAGHKKSCSTIFQVDSLHQQIVIAPLTLSRNVKEMQAVTVTAQKPFIERKNDRLVVNVASSIVSAGSTLLEVLEKSPGVLVNQESGINLKGKSGVNVMVDGKALPLSGMDLIAYLRSIPSANIDRIEIITNPSAKYDASGNAGIIDIRFKKDNREGYNGTATLSFAQGIYSKPMANASFNYRKKKWNLFAIGGASSYKTFSRFYINRKFFKDGNGAVESIFDQHTFTRMPQQAYNLRSGADYYASKKTVIGVLFSGSYSSSIRNGLSNADILKPDGALVYRNTTANYLTQKRRMFTGNFNIKHSFDSTGKELSADIDFGSFTSRPLQDIFINDHNPDGILISESKQKSDQQSQIMIRSVKADYTHPITKTEKLEAGIKAAIVTTDNNLQFFNLIKDVVVLNNSHSNHFIYTENVNAAYINYSRQLGKSSFQLGFRAEHTHSKGDQATTGQNINRDYIQLFPSVFFNHQLNDKNEASLSYSRRIDRPTYQQLNPFKILVDNYTYVSGDPYLFPVLTGSYQLGYTYNSKYNFTLSYLKSRNAITDVFIQDDETKVSTQIPANLQTYQQYNLTANIPVSVKKIVSSNLNAGLYYNKYDSPLQGAQLTNNFLSWDINVSNAFTIGSKGWSAELNGFYNSKVAWGQFIIKNMGQLSAGVQKISKNKRSVYKLSIADILATNHVAVAVQYQNQDWHTNRTWDSRYIAVAYSYKFGKNTIARARQRSTGVEEEKRRAG